MKKVLALVLTLTMLVGTLAVGLSAAYQVSYTDGPKYENVYTVPFGSTAAKVSYLEIGDLSATNRNFHFDLWFLSEDGYLGSDATYGSDNRWYVTSSEIGIKLNQENKTIPYAFDINTKYSIKIRTGDAEAGKTDIFVNDVKIGSVDGQLPHEKNLFSGGSNIAMDNITMSDGNDTQFSRDFDGTEKGSGQASGDKITGIEYRRELGLNHAVAAETPAATTVNVGDNWKNEDGTYTIGFDISFTGEEIVRAANHALTSDGDGISITSDAIGVGTTTASYTFKADEWYYVEYAVGTTKTQIFVNGVEVTGDSDFPVLSGASLTDTGLTFTAEGLAMDNLKVGNAAAIDFEGNDWADSFTGDGLVQNEYKVPEINLFDHISTDTVEGEGFILRSGFNSDKNPNPKTPNAAYLTQDNAYTAASYAVVFDVALYPDQENITNFSDKYNNGTWVEFVINKMADGDNSRVKFGDKFVGKGKDLWYYGEDATGAPDAVKNMTPWAAGDFHNVALLVAYGSVTLYIDQQEVYTANTGMQFFDGVNILYMNNGTAVIDNYKIYDAEFTLQTDGFEIGDGESSFTTVDDVKATGEDFCNANGHVYRWARTTEPKCYDEGTNTYTCYICGAADPQKEVAKLQHSYYDYDFTRVEENDEGNKIIYTTCKTSSGCTEKRFAFLPEADTYTGELTFFHDFTDDFMQITSSKEEVSFIFEDGVARYTDSEDNYNRIKLGTNRNGSDLNNNGFTIGFDFIFNDTYDTPATESYGHVFALNIGKQALGQAQVGYDADNEVFFIRGYNGAFKRTDSSTIKLVPGEKYNFEVKFYTPENAADMMSSELALYVNGVKVVEMAPRDAWAQCKYGSDAIDAFYFWNYGIAFDMDDFHIGSRDFSWNKDWNGDVDGDNDITVSDALLMRQYLAKIIDEEGFTAKSRADVNFDGSIDAKDQLRIRKHLAGENA